MINVDHNQIKHNKSVLLYEIYSWAWKMQLKSVSVYDHICILVYHFKTLYILTWKSANV